jgi:hypothetical protein
MYTFLTVSSVSSDSIVKGIFDDIINTAVKTAEVDEQKTKYLQHFIPQLSERLLLHQLSIFFSYIMARTS